MYDCGVGKSDCFHSGAETSLKAVCLSAGSKESVFYGSAFYWSIKGSEVF